MKITVINLFLRGLQHQNLIMMIYMKNKVLFDSFNNKLKKYRSLYEKGNSNKESIVNNLLSTIEQIGEEKFTIYEDVDVEYNYIK